MRRQRVFRPASLDGLEERLALSHGGAGLAALAAPALVAPAQAVNLHSGYHLLGTPSVPTGAGVLHAQRVTSAWGIHPWSRGAGRGFTLPLSLQLTNIAAGLAVFGPGTIGPVANPLLNSPFSNNFRVGGSSNFTPTFSSFFPRTTPFINGFNAAGLGFNGFGFPGFGFNRFGTPGASFGLGGFGFGNTFGSGFGFRNSVGFFNPLGNTFNGLGMAI